jgi:hypothetical protein
MRVEKPMTEVIGGTPVSQRRYREVMVSDEPIDA